MIIREIQQSDNKQIAAVIRQVFILENYPKKGTAFADSQLDFMFETYNTPKAVYYVIENNGKIMGGAGIHKLDHAGKNICELQKMYFLQEVRGKGMGFELIQKCLQRAKELGYEKCYLETLPEMRTAQKIYQNVGFEYLCSPMGGTGHTSCPIWMLKDLNPKS
ncbi:GNAT family N-acetyltransferase [Flavobacterium aciduliphilum]|uniref:Putative acetyltransferase n=1 Tax=Flavobacterium aciduliphilum TaxID=1101402 RepID=A0A328YPP2_9FLAO|nr:GNAT family N-acetyltransferase [Flavobacterium aciduliphilum]RAR75779.1 putative acetyltransferase [Flavobacterium aciduliphilum]